MKFCEKCGNQLSDEVVFCPKCGNAVADKQPTQAQNKNSRNVAKGIALIAAGVAVAVVFIILVCMQI